MSYLIYYGISDFRIWNIGITRIVRLCLPTTEHLYIEKTC
ncbi:hypothetical protein ANAPRD1_01202 [Anaplasma phagocytophilum]|nr:hypothetical protein ANAPRD1_01202 [Anaplasma phagocytophilum]